MIKQMTAKLHLNLKRVDKYMQTKIANIDLKELPRRKKKSSSHSVCYSTFFIHLLLPIFLLRNKVYFYCIQVKQFPKINLQVVLQTPSFQKSSKQHHVWRQKHLAMSTEPKPLEMCKKAQ